MIEEEHAEAHVSSVGDELSWEEEARLDPQSEVAQESRVNRLEDGHLATRRAAATSDIAVQNDQYS